MKYIFFDLDITLIDIKKAQNSAVEELYNVYNFSSKVDVSTFVKKWDELTEYHYAFYTRKEISYDEQRNRRVIDLFKAFDMPLEETPGDVYNVYLKYFEDNWCLFDDVYDVIKKLHEMNYKLGVISNGDLAQQSEKLVKTGIRDFFDIVTTSSEYEYSKPNPKLYESIIERFNINKEDMIMLGDEVKKDVLPCLSIGIEAIWLNIKGKPNENNVKEIKSMSEIFNYIK